MVVVPAGDSAGKAWRVHDSGSIIVGAVTQAGARAIFSNYGARVTIAAYGENIKALWGKYGETRYFGGTLAASAQIAGVVALAKELNPFLLPRDVKWLLKSSRDRSTENQFVGGKVNVTRFLGLVESRDVNMDDFVVAKKYRNKIVKQIKLERWAQ